MGGPLSIWSHWGILRRSDAWGSRLVLRRLILAGVMVLLVAGGSLAAWATGAWDLFIGVLGGALAVLFLVWCPIEFRREVKRQGTESNREAPSASVPE